MNVSSVKLCLIFLPSLAMAQAPARLTGPRTNAVVKSALGRMYNCDFTAANHLLDDYIRKEPADPLGHTFRASSDLFFELDRLKVLEGEFFADDKRIADKKGLKPDPNLRAAFLGAIERGRQTANQRLKANPNDSDALFALAINSGMAMDYTALIEKRQIASLSLAKDAQRLALQVLKVDPGYTDAYMTTGSTEYLLGSLPFFVKWFVKFDDAQGDKLLAVRKLERVVEGGRYLGPFAKILLSLIHLREKRLPQSVRLLDELTREFPENPLFKKELVRVKELAAAQ
ncbi:MAG: hypothetical protein K2X03_25900 [Bryobacteraceae bacterium]|nr:hypothetical protein [Bryobacteraceae bacterium]